MGAKKNATVATPVAAKETPKPSTQNKKQQQNGSSKGNDKSNKQPVKQQKQSPTSVYPMTTNTLVFDFLNEGVWAFIFFIACNVYWFKLEQDGASNDILVRQCAILLLFLCSLCSAMPSPADVTAPFAWCGFILGYSSALHAIVRAIGQITGAFSALYLYDNVLGPLLLKPVAGQVPFPTPSIVVADGSISYYLTNFGLEFVWTTLAVVFIFLLPDALSPSILPSWTKPVISASVTSVIVYVGNAPAMSPMGIVITAIRNQQLPPLPDILVFFVATMLGATQGALFVRSYKMKKIVSEKKKKTKTH